MTDVAIMVLIIIGFSAIAGYIGGLAIYYRSDSAENCKEFLIIMMASAIVIIDVFLIMQVFEMHIEKYYLIQQTL